MKDISITKQLEAFHKVSKQLMKKHSENYEASINESIYSYDASYRKFVLTRELLAQKAYSKNYEARQGKARKSQLVEVSPREIITVYHGIQKS